MKKFILAMFILVSFIGVSEGRERFRPLQNLKARWQQCDRNCSCKECKCGPNCTCPNCPGNVKNQVLPVKPMEFLKKCVGGVCPR